MEKFHAISWKAFFAAKSFMKRQAGQGMTEYGLIIALVAVVLIATLTSMGDKLNGKFTEIVGALSK
jgi:pilus assembly protein Flp/PilA